MKKGRNASDTKLVTYLYLNELVRTATGRVSDARQGVIVAPVMTHPPEFGKGFVQIER